jgi:cyclophilin family peptidyl-prolyl cis-trans isomerase/HEAT repeat protein
MPSCRAYRSLTFSALPLLFLALGCGADPSDGPGGTSSSDKAPGGEAGAATDAIPFDAPVTFQDISEDTTTFLDIVEMEDRRAGRSDDLERLARATDSSHPGIRRVAVRALGRLEVGEVLDSLTPLLRDPHPRVGAEAANALAQIARSLIPGELEEVRRSLRDLASEAGDEVRVGAVARSLGRLPVASREEVGEMEETLLQLFTNSDSQEETLHLGIARGVHSLYRQGAEIEGWRPSGAATARVSELAREGGAPPVRIAAAHALWVAGAVTLDEVRSWLEDPDPEVRRVGAGALSALGDVTSLPSDSPEEAAPGSRAMHELLRSALVDVSERVRIEAVRSWDALVPPDQGCGPLLVGVEDASDHVALVSLGVLADRCLGDSEIDELLHELASALPDRGQGAGDELGEGRGDVAEEGLVEASAWQRSTAALSTLTHRSPNRGRELLPLHARHSNPFVRTHAARSAGIVGAGELLEELARDDAPNVREAAVRGLAASPSRLTPALLRDQLLLDDPMLLRSTAQLLEGRMAELEGEGLVEELLGALERLTAAGALTSRDARVPLLRRIGESEHPGVEGSIRSYLGDFDPVVAELAADLLRQRGESDVVADPAEPKPEPLPGLSELRAMDRDPVTVHMAGGGRFSIHLLPFEAPTNAARFVRMAEAGAFDGLTLHRVVPNFVIQGGSPGANEYAGHGAYTRDEVGLIGHWRGAVGVSTRGRDTGDGQIFVNLVTNLRLDHDYTIFGLVTSGLDVVDRIQEGARIERVTVGSSPGH